MQLWMSHNGPGLHEIVTPPAQRGVTQLPPRSSPILILMFLYLEMFTDLSKPLEGYVSWDNWFYFVTTGRRISKWGESWAGCYRRIGWEHSMWGSHQGAAPSSFPPTPPSARRSSPTFSSISAETKWLVAYSLTLQLTSFFVETILFTLK